jgi:hypothetical protein
VIIPGLVVIAGIRAEGGHEAGEVVAILASDMLLHSRNSGLQTLHTGLGH